MSFSSKPVWIAPFVPTAMESFWTVIVSARSVYAMNAIISRTEQLTRMTLFGQHLV